MNPQSDPWRHKPFLGRHLENMPHAFVLLKAYRDVVFFQIFLITNPTGAVHCFPPGYRSTGILSGHQKAVRSADSSDPVLMHKPRWHCPDIPGSESDPIPLRRIRLAAACQIRPWREKDQPPRQDPFSAPSASEARDRARLPPAESPATITSLAPYPRYIR